MSFWRPIVCLRALINKNTPPRWIKETSQLASFMQTTDKRAQMIKSCEITRVSLLLSALIVIVYGIVHPAITINSPSPGSINSNTSIILLSFQHEALKPSRFPPRKINHSQLAIGRPLCRFNQLLPARVSIRYHHHGNWNQSRKPWTTANWIFLSQSSCWPSKVL